MRRRNAIGAWARTHVVEVVFLVLGLLARVVFWQVSERKFEDGLITVTHARNAAEGLGLTHHPFEPVTHGFTTAVSVLIPLAGELLDFVPGVDGFLTLRLASLLAFVVTIVATSRIATLLGLGTWPRVLVYGLLAFSFNHIYYGMAGMETQVALAVLLCAIAATMERRAVASGVLYGLCVLSRPDFVIFVGLALLWWLLQDRRGAVRIGLIALAVVAPWLIFTTIYYGSPVPNTIPAKELRYAIDWPTSLSPSAWWDFLSSSVSQREDWLTRFASPFIEHVFVTDAPWLRVFSTWFIGGLLALAIAGIVASRRVAGWWPAIGFAVIYLVYRLVALPPNYYDWYYPPLTALLVLLAAVALQRLSALTVRGTAAIALAVTVAFAWAFVPLTVLESRYQQEVENKVRYPLGLFLRAQVPKGSVVTSESAGYVGYYSAGNIKLWDYPGLTSKEAYEIEKILGPERSTVEWLAHAAQPDYAVWRPFELESFQKRFPETAARYEVAARFKVEVPDERLKWGGVQFSNVDRQFLLMRRVSGELGGVERARQVVAEDEARRR